ncbi:MAG TPA: nitrate- and nitrite sensing domain-containing protein [Candidatus Aquabacterium excrementipullorum]|nr:nitrate- and nitrite sensing domain-containing protein [Candidatus Aquabacterium excrementipullorum]
MSSPSAPAPAPVSVSHLVLRAKQLEIDALKHLAARAELVDVVGQLIHALQRERGATSIYLASGGQQFVDVRQAAVAEAQPLEAQARALFATQLEPAQGASARMLSMMAWALMGLDVLDGLRAQIEQRTLSAHDSVAAFSRLIAGLVELIFHVADATAHPGISRLLVAFLHLVQSKEAAGQERAVGALLYASGRSDEAQQQRLVHLIDAQENSLRVFEEFAEPALRTRWEQHLLTPGVARLERLRRTLCTARPGAALDAQLSDDWFEVSSAHITAQWELQQQLVQALRQHCEAQVRAAEQALLDAEGLLRQLRDNPPPHSHAVERFFDAAVQPGSVPLPAAVTEGLSTKLDTAAQAQASSLLDLLQAQSTRLASMEAELETARRTLNERKVIERAKGVLMSRMGLTEEAAFRALQKTSMDQNRRLLDVAEATLSLPDFAFPKRT